MESFLLLRNPAIQIIGNRNERERSNRTSSSTATTSMTTTPSSTTTAASAAAAAASNAAAAASTSAAKAVISPAGNEKPEPHCQTQDPKEEASSRLEALLRCTSQQLSVSSHDLRLRPQIEVARFDLTSPPLWPTQQRVVVAQEQQPRNPSDEASPPSAQNSEAAAAENQHCGGGKRYRSSIRIMVRPEAVTNLQRPVRANSSDGLSRSSSSSSGTTTAAKKMSAAGVRITTSRTSEVGQPPASGRSIVKEQFRYDITQEAST